MNIGILYPRSSVHASLGFDFLDGIKSFLRTAGLDNRVSFTTEGVGFGGVEKEIFEKAEKLLLIERVDILVAYLDQRVLHILQPLFLASGKLIIVVNPGANYPLNWVPQQNVVQLTLQHAFLCWLSGGAVAVKNEKGAAVVTSYYDGGYLHSTSMVKSFVKEGGEVAYNYVINQAYDDSLTIAPLTDFLATNKGTNLILAVLDTIPAALLYNRLNASAVDNLHLHVSGMMLEPAALKDLSSGYHFSISGYISWQQGLETDTNKKFTAACKNYSKKEPSMFSLLGWEVGLIIQQAMVQEEMDAAVTIDQLKAVKLDSPRGALQLDADTQFFLAPVGKCSVPEGNTTMDVEWITDTAKQWQEFTTEPTEGVISGWMNTYLCY